MFALIRFTFMLPGLSAPNVSCATLPMAPVGVVSVSPVTRQATSARKNDMATAITLCHTGMLKLTFASQHSATSDTSCPATNHEAGVSIASISPFALCAPVTSPRSPRKAFAIALHCMENARRPETTMHETPPQRVHWTSFL